MRRPRRPAYSTRPEVTARDKIAWRICNFAARTDGGCACEKRGEGGHCEAVAKVAETVFTWAQDDLARQEHASEVSHG